MDEKFHTYEDLALFKKRYRILSDMLREADYKILYIDRSAQYQNDTAFVSFIAMLITKFL